jgi:hypothetical protein
MKWLILGASLVAAALALWVLAAERRPGRRRSTPMGLVTAVAALVLIGAVAYAARFASIYSLPFLVVLFVPFGLASRWLVLATRDARDRREAAQPPVQPSWRQRALAVAAWPIFVALVVLVALVGLAAAMLAAYR